MRDRVKRALIVLGLAGALSAQIPEGRAVLVVTTVDALTQAPLADTNIKIEGGTPGIMVYARQHSTGIDGATTFERLAAGAYRVLWQRKGYVSAWERTTAELVRLTRDEGTERLTLRLTPLGSLAGQVRDEDGQPMRGVAIYSRLAGAGPKQCGVTDEEGRFHAIDIAPGDYTLFFRVTYDARKQTLRRDPESGETYGYPDSAYYPDATGADGGVRIHATAGSDLTGLNIRLRRVRLVEFAGTLLDRVTREPMRGVRLSLVQPGSPFLEAPYAIQRPPDSGAFRFDLLQPGHYELAISTPSTPTLPITVPVELGKAGWADAVILPPALQKIAGRIVPLPDGEKWSGAIYLTLQGNGMGRENSIVQDGEFQLDGIPPGEWRLEARAGARRASDGKRLVIAAVRFGAVDALDKPIAIGESGNPPLEVTLTADAGSIQGGVNLERAPQVQSVYLRRAGQARVEMEYIRPDGSFAFQNLAPGAYELAARLDVRLSEGPVTRVEVKPGETARVQLDATR